MPRAISSGALTFGLVTVPVRVYVAASSQSVSFNMLTPKGNPVKQVLVDKVTGQGVDRKECIKGFKVAKDKYVQFSSEEMKRLTSDSSKAIEIKEFVAESQLHPLGVEKTYYLSPGDAGEKAYSLFAKVMADKNVCAIGQWTSRNKDHLVAIRPFERDGFHGMIMQQLFYNNEIRTFAGIGVPSTVSVSEAEMEMATKLVDTLVGKFDASKYKDEFSERVQAAVDAKLAGQEVSVPAFPDTSTLDLLDALKASLEADKKKVV